MALLNLVGALPRVAGAGAPENEVGGTAFNPAVASATLKCDLNASAFGAGAYNTQIASWPDSSGSGNAASQATSSLQPFLRPAQINGLSAVQFDAIDDSMTFGSQFVTPPDTVYLVAQFPHVVNVFLMSSNQYILTDISGALGINAGSQLSSGVVPPATTWYLLRAVFNGASSLLDNQFVNIASGNAGAAQFNAGGGETIGQASGCSVARILIYQGQPNGTDNTYIINSLKAIYNL